MINKQEIKQRFLKSSGVYDQYASVQKIVVRRLKELIYDYLPEKPEKTLEIGCGTGLLTKELVEIVNLENFFINDLVEDLCIHTGSSCSLPKQAVIAGDIENIEFPYGLDLIASASAFQWFTNPQKMYANLADHLLPSGYLIFNTFGPDNLMEVKRITDSGLNYPSLSLLSEQLSKDFEILFCDEERHTLYFEDPADILKHMKYTGVNSLNSNKIWTKRSLNHFLTGYREFKEPEGYTLTYHPLYFVCRSEK